MKHLRQYIRGLLKESKEDVAKIMQLNDEGEWEQARELAYMMGPEVSRHPDLFMWDLIDGETGDVLVAELNYDQATSLEYMAFAALGGYSLGHAWGESAREHPPTQKHFDEAMAHYEDYRSSNQELRITDEDDEEQYITVVWE